MLFSFRLLNFMHFDGEHPAFLCTFASCFPTRRRKFAIKYLNVFRLIEKAFFCIFTMSKLFSIYFYLFSFQFTTLNCSDVPQNALCKQEKKSFCKFLPLGAAADTAALINLAIFLATRKKSFYAFKIKKVCSYCEQIYENL